MELDELRALVTVVQEGSISGAARRLYRSQSVVTRQVQALERAVGGSLLDRRSRPLSATAMGKRVVEHARRALAAVEQLKGAAAAEGAEPSGELRIGVGFSVVEILMRVPLARLRQSFPRLVLSIKSDWSQHLPALLRDGALDVGLLLLPPGWAPPAPLEGRELAVEPMIVIAPRTARPGRGVDITTLPGTRWVVNPEGCACRSALRRLYAAAGSALDVAVEVHGSSMQIELVAAGLGFGLVPVHALDAHPRRHAVTVVPMKSPLLSFGIWFVSAPVPPLLKGAVELMIEGIGRVLQQRGRRQGSPKD
jgi:DNA-binding transcriptional LysR family regulator